MNGLQNTVRDNTTVREAIELMGQNHVPAIAVVDEDMKLLGLFTNGDMRRFFLEGGNLADSISGAMNANPVCFSSLDEVTNAKEQHPYIVYPLINEERTLQALLYGNESDRLVSDVLAGVPLVMMAGGKGTRLYPYTKILPKALVPVGDVSIAERIIDQFYCRGCREVWFILNHKAEMIKAYFEGIDIDYDVHFLLEKRFQGTGGGLALLKGSIDSTFVVSNCDILIEDDLSCAFKTHKELGDAITYVGAMVHTSVPYGVIETDDKGYVESLREKPQFDFLVSTGVYIVEPEVLDLIEPDEVIDFPDIVKRCMNNGGKVGVFPVPESSWIDIGELSKMRLAAQRFDGLL